MAPRDPRSSPNPRKGDPSASLRSRTAARFVGLRGVYIRLVTNLYGLSDGATGTYAGRAYRHYHLHCPRRDVPPQTVRACVAPTAERQRERRPPPRRLTDRRRGPRTVRRGARDPTALSHAARTYWDSCCPGPLSATHALSCAPTRPEFLQSLRHWRTRRTPPDNLDFLRRTQRVERAHAPLARGAFTPSCRRPGRRGSWPRGSRPCRTP